MLPKEVLKNIRYIQITTNRLVSDVFAGHYHSIFKGRGIEFDEVREYTPGDEIRSIDWNVTARMGHPFVKKFVEERELTVMLMVDLSGSSYFGSVNKMKSQIAAEVCSLLAFSAIKNNDRVGFIAFTDAIEKFIPPRKGTSHVLRVVREALYFRPKSRLTDISKALEFLNRVTTRKTVTFVISDFYDEDFDRQLIITNRRHDVVAVTITDPLELELSNAGLVSMIDAETGREYLIDTSSKEVREDYRKKSLEKFRNRQDIFKSARVDNIDIRTNIPYTRELISFFRHRERKMR